MTPKPWSADEIEIVRKRYADETTASNESTTAHGIKLVEQVPGGTVTTHKMR